MSEYIVTDWLSSLSQTAAQRDHPARMQLISRRVSPQCLLEKEQDG